MYHSAVTFANAFMHAGTTIDEFLRQNLEWLSRATNWSKFSATAALGVIHKVTREKAILLSQHVLTINVGSIGTIHELVGALSSSRRWQ